jgi:hypothetical protein
MERNTDYTRRKECIGTSSCLIYHNERGRIGMTRFLIGAGGVDNGGCPAPTYFYDACTRV